MNRTILIRASLTVLLIGMAVQMGQCEPDLPNCAEIAGSEGDRCTEDEDCKVFLECTKATCTLKRVHLGGDCHLDRQCLQGECIGPHYPSSVFTGKCSDGQEGQHCFGHDDCVGVLGVVLRVRGLRYA